MVLEAWCYTRAAGTEVIHVATTGSILTAARSVDIQGAVINTRVVWVTAATGILVYWYTGILVYWYTGVLVYWYLKYTGSHNIHFVYTLCHCFDLFINGSLT